MTYDGKDGQDYVSSKPIVLVEITKDALGWLLVYARDVQGHREGEPVGEPDYYKSRSAALAAAKQINERGVPPDWRTNPIITARTRYINELIEAAAEYKEAPVIRAFLRQQLNR